MPRKRGNLPYHIEAEDIVEELSILMRKQLSQLQTPSTPIQSGEHLMSSHYMPALTGLIEGKVGLGGAGEWTALSSKYSETLGSLAGSVSGVGNS